MLLTNERASYSSPGTLARVPAVGGTPRQLVERATYGDWAPDGERLAVNRDGVCEFPIGRPVAEQCGTVRVSPRSDRLAVVSIKVEIIEAGGQRLASDPMPFVYGHAWSPDGRDVWFTGSESGRFRAGAGGPSTRQAY